MSDKVISILVALFIIILFVSACFTDHVEGDDSAMNCVWAIIIILGLIKKS